MSYVVLARKYRPRRFSELVGQEHVATTLLNALATDRMVHALLFTGTRGVGKTSAARILAKAINCEARQQGEPCNACRHCRGIDDGSHLDVMEIDGASNRSVEDAKELQERIGYPPTQGAYRVFIIDEVHMLTREAFNSLLKTIEEPPPNLVFIFATTEVQKVPETILSRVQRFDFKRIYPHRIQQALREICEKEKIPYEPEALGQVAEKADGSMRDALSLLDQALSFSQQNLTARAVQESLGLVDASSYRKLVEALLGRDRPAVLRMVEELFMRGADIGEFTQGLHAYFRDLLVVKVSSENCAGLGILPNHLETYKHQAAALSQKDLLRALETISGLIQRVTYSSFPKFELEITLLKLMEMDASLDIQQFLSSLERGQPPAPAASLTPSASLPPAISRPPVASPSPAGSVPPPAAPAAAPIKPTELNEETWKSWYEEMISANAAAGIALSTSRLIRYTGNKLVLAFPRSIISFQVDQLKRRKNFDFLSEFFKQRLGHMPELEFQPLEEETGTLPGQPEEPKAVPEAKKEKPARNINDALQDPLVKSALEIFDGEVIN